MLPPDSRTTAFDLVRPPSGYRLDFAVLTTYTLDLEALLVLPLSVLAHPDGGLEELLADPLRLHQAIRDAGDRVHAFVDEKGIAIPRGARSLYSMLESSVHPVRAPNRGAFHPKVWAARFTAGDGAADELLRVAVLSRNLTFDRSWDIALASEALLRSRRRVAASRPLHDLLLALPRLATGHIAPGIVERVEALADQVTRTALPAPDGFDSPIEFHAIGLSARRRHWSPPSSGHRTLAVAPFVNRTGLDAVGRLSGGARVLVSRQEELDRLPDDALAAWEEVFVLSDTAQGEVEDAPPDTDEDGTADTAGARPSGLHAKMIAVEHGWKVTWTVGSANLTAAALTGSNVEMMASVTGKRGSKGGASGCGIDRFLDGFQKLCVPYRRIEPEQEDPETASQGAAGSPQGRAAPRPGAGRLLRAARPHQRPRGLRPDERLLVPDPDRGRQATSGGKAREAPTHRGASRRRDAPGLTPCGGSDRWRFPLAAGSSGCQAQGNPSRRTDTESS